MKIHINTNKILTGMFMLLLALPLVSCNDDDSNGGLPVIHRVRTTDPQLKDSAFVQATPEQMLLIEGENLGSVKKVFINNQDVYFNPNYVTSRTIIVTIPKDLKLTGANPDLPKEIRVETGGGIATYSFHVLSPAPAIKRLEIKYPVEAGDNIIIHGENFYEISKIVMEGENGTNVAIAQYIINSAFNAIMFRLPEGVEEFGEIVVYCAAGEAGYPYATVVQPPAITLFSSDMPVIGAEFFITGTYFIDVEKVNINGEYDILANDLRVSESNDTIYLKLPSEPSTSGTITITAAGGASEDNKLFYPVEFVIADYDRVGSLNWVNDGKEVEGDGITPPYVTTGKAAGIIKENLGTEWWFGNLSTGIEYTNAIAGNVSVNDLVVRFECFVAYPLETIYLEVMLGDHWSYFYTDYRPRSIVSGKTEIGKWMTCEISIADLVVDAQKYSDVKTLGNEICFFSKNPGNGDIKIPKYEIYFDNFRILQKSKK